jgi:hypothetical protein
MEDAMATVQWQGGNGGDWATGSNWSSGTVPGASDTAEIESGSAIISGLDAGITVDNVTIGSPSAGLSVLDPGQTQTITGALTNDGSFDVDQSGAGGSSVVINGALTNASGAGIAIGNAGLASSTSVEAGSLVDGGALTIDGGSASATATLAVLGASSLSGVTFNMNAFGVLDTDATLTLTGVTVASGSLASSPTGAIISVNSTFNNVGIAALSTLQVKDSEAATLSGAIANDGTIQVGTSSGGAIDIANAGVSLSGRGEVEMVGANASIGGGALVNVDDTILGSGTISGLADNQANGVVDANQSKALALSGNADNEGLLEATSGAELELGLDTITQNANSGDGEILAAGAGSNVFLFGATVVGGSLETSGGGFIKVENGALKAVEIAADSLVEVVDSTSVTLTGSFANLGTIDLGVSTGGELVIANAGATLTGGGEIVMIGVDASIGGGALVNADDTIEGSGSISGLPSFDNQANGLIEANQAKPLVFSNNADNEGLLEAASGAELEIGVDNTVTQNAHGGDGEILATGAGSNVFLFGATIVGGVLVTSSGGVIKVENGALNAVEIAAGALVEALDGTSVTLSNSIVNRGTIDVGVSTGGGLQIASAGATLAGGGVIDMIGASATIGGGALVNADDTIEGSGSIGGLTSFNNQAGAVIDANQSKTLVLSGSADNEGLLEATNGAELEIGVDNTVTQNANSGDGTISAAGGGSNVLLFGSTVVGGVLETSGDGLIKVENGGLNAVTIAAGSIVEVGDGEAVDLTGSIANHGTLEAGVSTGGGISIASAGATLTGGGEIVMTGADSSISGGALVNVDDLIAGAGDIDSLTSFTNQPGGVVKATKASTTLSIFSISGGVTNNGILAADNGATLSIAENVTGSGVLQVGDDATVQLNGESAERTNFSGPKGTLKLITPSSYTGDIYAFAVGDTLELSGVSATKATPTADGANTTLTVTVPGSSSLTYTLIGNYVGDTFNVTDSGGVSFVTVTASGAPTLGSAGNTVNYAPHGAGLAIDSNLTVQDTGASTLTSATVEIETGFLAGDTLNFTSQDGITGHYNGATGVLWLSGSASVADYQTTLESVTFSSSASDPTNNGADLVRTIDWAASDGAAISQAVSSNVDIVAAIALGAGNVVSYTAGGPATVLDASLTATDNSGLALTDATIAIKGGFLAGDTLNFVNQNGITGSYVAATGRLTLNGAATVAQYQAALQSITYSSSALDPSSDGADPNRTVEMMLRSGTTDSNIATTTIDVVGPAVVGGGGATADYVQAGAAAVVDAGITIADPSSGSLTGATIAISAGFVAGDALHFLNADGIFGSYNAQSGVLTLTGDASLAAYQSALDSITFSSSAADVTNGGADPTRTIDWTVSDNTATSNVVTSTIDAAIAGPSLSGAGNTAEYVAGGNPTRIDPALTVADASSSTLTGATVKISSGLLAGDLLSFVNQDGITGSYNATSGVLTLTGTATLADYQAALESITFGSISSDPTNGGADPTRAISWSVASGSQQSAAVTSTIDVSVGLPAVSGGGASATFTLGGSPVVADSGLSVGDSSSPTLTGATVKISAGFQAGDTLNFTARGGVTGSYNTTTGVLTLSGTASLAVYSAILDSVVFSTTASSFTPRTLSFVAIAGAYSSAAVTSTVNLAALPPIIGGAGNTVGATNLASPVAVDSKLTLADTSSSTLTSATVSITAATFLAGDVLAATLQGGVTDQYNKTTGVLTLSGAASLAVYQAILDSITFQATTIDNNSSTRTIDWQAFVSIAGGQNESSAVATTTVNVAPAIPYWINPAGGSFNVATNWSTDDVPSANKQPVIGAIDGANDTFTVTSSVANTVGALQIDDPDATLSIAGGSVFSIGNLATNNNKGAIDLADDDALDLSGTLDNTGVITATVSTSSAIIEGGVIDNAGGSILDNGAVLGATSVAALALESTDIEGGTINGFFSVPNDATLSGSASSPILIGDNGEIELLKDSVLTLSGTIDLQGWIETYETNVTINISGDTTVNAVAPSGEHAAGAIQMGSFEGTYMPNTADSLVASTAGSELTLNAYLQVVGGNVGNANMSLDVDAAGELYAQDLPVTINTGSNTIINNGAIVESGRYINNVPSILTIDSAISGTGGLYTAGYDGQVQINSSVASSQSVYFELADTSVPEPSLTGVFQLAHAETFDAGQIVDMGSESSTQFDSIDLMDFKWGHTSIDSVTGGGAAGTLTNVQIVDLADNISVTLHLFNSTANEYLASANDYTLASDGAATPGTLFSVDHTFNVQNTGNGFL